MHVNNNKLWKKLCMRKETVIAAIKTDAVDVAHRDDGDAAAATWKHSAGTAYDSIFHGKSRHTKSTRRRDIDSDS